MISSERETVHVSAIGRDIGKLSDERTRQVKQLLKLNHDNYSILYNNYRFHNHSPHFLGSAYLYDGPSGYLQEIYNDLVVRDNLESWTTSPGHITLNNYRTYLGKGEYQRAWIDLFEAQWNEAGESDNWQGVAIRFLFDIGPNGEAKSAPMFHCLNTALGHPLIHLGYAFELNSPELAAEALGLVATCYDEQYAAILATKPASAPTAQKPTSDLLGLFRRVSSDMTLPTFSQPGDENIDDILARKEHVNAVVSHMNAWDLSDPTFQLSQAYYFASLLLISTAPQLSGDGYDFFLVHLLTTIHAVRVLFPHLPAQHHATLLREWILVAILAYVAQKRPRLDVAYVRDFSLQEGQDWEYVRQHAIAGKFSTDAHFVKACRALHVGAETWKGKAHDDEWFLKCAVRFVTEFDGWGGFNTEADDAELVRENRKKDGIYVR